MVRPVQPGSGAGPGDSEVMGYTGHLIRRAQQRHAALWQRRVSDTVSSPQFAVLVALDANPGASQRQLGDELDLDRSTVADLVGRMVRNGLVERRRGREDRRVNSVWLTDDGRATLQHLRPLVQARLAGIDGAATWCGWGIYAHNCDKIGQLIAKIET